MFYRIVALALSVLGLIHIISHLSWPLNLNPDTVENSAIGLVAIILGLLNFNYFYEAPHTRTPRIVFYATNLLFIGFSILLITSDIAQTYGMIAVGGSLINCVVALNHKV